MPDRSEEVGGEWVWVERMGGDAATLPGDSGQEGSFVVSITAASYVCVTTSAVTSTPVLVTALVISKRDPTTITTAPTLATPTFPLATAIQRR